MTRPLVKGQIAGFLVLSGRLKAMVVRDRRVTRRFGTQDFVEINPLYVWKRGEQRFFRDEISRRSGRPSRRVSFVVSYRYRWSFPVAERDYAGGPAHERFLYTRVANSTDWLICREAVRLIAEIESHPRRWARLLSAAQRSEDAR